MVILEAPVQKKAREDFEAMGGIWAGTASSIKNPMIYADCIGAQIKVGLDLL